MNHPKSLILDSVKDRMYQYPQELVDELPLSEETKSFLVQYGLIENFKNFYSAFSMKWIEKNPYIINVDNIDYLVVYKDEMYNFRLIAVELKSENVWLLFVNGSGYKIFSEKYYLTQNLITYTKCNVFYHSIVSTFLLSQRLPSELYPSIENIVRGVLYEIDPTCDFTEGSLWWETIEYLCQFLNGEPL